MHKAKIGVIGAGWWATEYHIPHLKEREDVELTSVCKIEENELDFLKNKFGFKYASTNYLEALDFEKLDGVVIASPHFAHFENTKAAIERGYHIAVEKPMTTNSKDAQIIYDFVKVGEKFIAASGGKGGLGNTRFKSSTNRAPRKFTKGKPGEDFIIWLQLKTIADIGIIGLPNAGKSSLLAAITNANPKIANYQFTTLNPNLGVASYDNKEVTIADIPGLIEGAHKGTGLGIQFLKHIERCKSLLHMIDISNNDLKQSYNQVKNELKKYGSKLSKKKRVNYLK